MRVLQHILVGLGTLIGMVVLFYAVVFVLVFLGVIQLDVGAGYP